MESPAKQVSNRMPRYNSIINKIKSQEGKGLLKQQGFNNKKNFKCKLDKLVLKIQAVDNSNKISKMNQSQILAELRWGSQTA